MFKNIFYTLRSRLILIFSLLIIIPFTFMVFIISDQAKSMIGGQIESSAFQTMEQYSTYANMLIKQANDIAYQVSGSSLTQEWLSDISRNFDQDNAQVVLNYKVRDLLSSISTSNSIIDSVTIFHKKGYAIGRNNVFRDPTFLNQSWYREVIDNGAQWEMANTDYTQPNFLLRETVISYIFPLVQVSPFNVVGVIKINIDTSTWEETMNNMRLGNTGYFDLITSAGHSVMHPLDKQYRAEASLIYQTDYLNSKIGKARTEEGSDSSLTFFHKLDNSWSIVGIVSEKELFLPVTRIVWLLVAFVAGLLILSIFLAILFSKSITKPLSRLSLAMKDVERGNFSSASIPGPPISGQIGYVQRVFNEMLIRIETMIQKEFQLNLRRRDAEYKALLMQINPHFLYNTLEVIGGLAARKKHDVIMDVTESLGDMLRYSLRLENELVTLKEELQYVLHYLSIMEARYAERIKWEVSDHSNLSDRLIIKFILQPLVENAVKYSIAHAESPEVIIISENNEDGRLRISVTDNGMGMPLKIKEELISYKSDMPFEGIFNHEGKQIGLRNVIARCQLYYGNRFHYEVITKEGLGTTIQLIIPISEEKTCIE